MCQLKLMDSIVKGRGESRYWETVYHNDSPWPNTRLSSRPHFPEPLFMFCYSPKHQVSRYLPSLTLLILYIATGMPFLLSLLCEYELSFKVHVTCLHLLGFLFLWTSPGSFVCPFPVAYECLSALSFYSFYSFSILVGRDKVHVHIWVLP